MAQAKQAYYWEQLRSALAAGQWESLHPCKAPNGTSLSWPELLRKFRKHCPRDANVAEAASQTQSLSLLLARHGLTAKDLDGDCDGANGPFDLGNECLLPEESVGEAQKSYDGLQQLDSSKNESIRHILAYFAYALGRPADCLSVSRDIKCPASLHPSSSVSSTGPALSVPGTVSQSSNDISFAASTTSLGVKDERALAVMESIRTFCLQGMSHEKLSPSSSSNALSCYGKGIDILLSFNIPKSLPSRSGRANFDSFTQYRELWRWSEMLLWRAISLSARHRSIESSMPLFRAYALHSGHWPATFRPSHRRTVSSLYLRALVLLASRPNSSHDRHTYTNEARSVIHEYRAILNATTHFPRSGERNVAVEEFVDLCVAVWEASGATGDQAGWVLDVMWWATRLTFNSQRILRHMTRLFHVAGEHDLAKRTLRLYVQIASKAREAGGSENEGAMDSDRQWVETLVQGARMLCRLPGTVAEAREAGKLVEHARARLDPADLELVASVDLADGVCKTVLALREQEPSTRGPLLTESLAVLTRSLETHPTPAAYFQTALSLIRPGLERNLALAIQYTGRAVEGDSKEIRYWHLLALLEAKAGEWKKARGVLEVAAEFTEDVEVQIQAEAIGTNGVTVKDFASHDVGADPQRMSSSNLNGSAPDGRTHDNPSTLIPSSATTLPSTAALLKPLPDHPPSSQRELFEHALQLRMTLLALTEHIEGPENAGAKWLEVFEWYADRRDTTAQVRSTRPSMDGRRSVSQNSRIDQNNVGEPLVGLFQQQGDGGAEAEEMPQSPESHLSPPMISINYIPPTPETEQEKPALVGDSPPSSMKEKTNGSERRSQSQSPERGRDRDTSKGKKVQKMLKDGVHKGQARINTISKKIGQGVVKGSGVSLHRSNSAPDFHAVLARTGSYQASSIHSRKKVISWGSKSNAERNVSSPVSSLLPPPSLPPPHDMAPNDRTTRERRLLSDLWLTSAATFRRLGKIEQARGAIQEAEVLDEENEAVWVQLGLYFSALGDDAKAIESFHKALFIAPDDPSALVHLCRLYLTPDSPSQTGAVDLAAGMLENLTRGVGWDVPEAWYLLAKAYGMQGRKVRERECLAFALGLVEARGVRDVGVAVGCCL